MPECPRCSREMSPTDVACPDCGVAAEAADAVIVRHEPGEPPLEFHHRDSVVPPAEQLPAADSSAWGRRELMAIPAALVGGALLTFALLSSRGVASPEAAASTEPAANARAAASRTAAPRPASSTTGAGWSRANVARWIGNGRRSFAAEVVADNNVPIWQREVRPVLVLRCLSQRPELFVFTDSAAKIEPRTEDHTVRLTIDEGQEIAERWPDSADHDALFAPDGAAFARQLAGARTLRFGFTPHNAPPVVAQFNVAGLDKLLDSSARECGWKK